MARLKTKTEVISSRAIFEQKIDTIAQHEVSIQTLEAERDAKNEALLLHYNTQIKALKKESEGDMKVCLAYAKEHRSELAEKDKRSADTPLATYGFRTGMPTVEKLDKRKEEDLANELYDQGHKPLVTTKHSLDKPAILKTLQAVQALKADAQAGFKWLTNLFKIDQGETFYVSPKAQDTK